MVPKKAMAVGSYAVATTKVESQCPHISGGVGGDMSAEEKHIDSVLRKRDKGDFNFLPNFVVAVCNDGELHRRLRPAI
jgi:hypothetical protein